MYPPVRILITGSRVWVDRQRAADGLLYALSDLFTRPELHDLDWGQVTVVHGAAPGLDCIGASLAEQWGMRTDPHKADWARYGHAAGPIRNAEMVNAGAHICVGYPLGISVGTRGCMALAVAAGIRVINFGDLELPLTG